LPRNFGAQQAGGGRFGQQGGFQAGASAGGFAGAGAGAGAMGGMGGFDPNAMAMMYQNMMKSSGMGMFAFASFGKG